MLNGTGELHVTLENSSYVSACRVIMERALQVCEQIGCPLCSLIACVYAEHINRAVMIDRVERSKNNIN